MSGRSLNLYAICFAYVAIRAQLANRMPITDCDEVYNYWEPLHFLAFGSGMQTWEYASQYALRTYAYLYPLWGGIQFLRASLPSLWLQSIALTLTDSPVQHSSKLAVFVILRSTLAAAMGAAEVNWLIALCEDVPFNESLVRQPLVSRTVAFTTGICMLTSTGMGHASGALLPSSTFLMAFLICSAAYIRHQVRLFIVVAVTATLGIGWPFGVIVLVPMGVHILWMYRQRLVSILVGTALYTITCQAIIMAIDYQHYGRWTSATLNIFMYNAAGGGDELYGIEPTSFYVKNLALNFNYLATLAPAVVPVLGLRRSLFHRPSPAALSVVCSSLYFWFATVIPRPHKEERFLFPIYPILCLGAVVVVEQIWDTLVGVFRTGRKNDEVKPSRPYWFLLLLPSCVLGLARLVALSKYYTAPLAVYSHLPNSVTSTMRRTPGLVCTCGEWYRFPSSFYLGDHQRIAFLKSSFSGQLPRQFEAEGSIADVPTFNDQNAQEMDRYVGLKDCAYLIEMEGSDCLVGVQEILEPMYSSPYLDSSATSTLHRTIYLPFGLHAGTYLNYTLFRVTP